MQMSLTRWLMTASALFMGLLGLAGTFLPGEILQWAGAFEPGASVILIQILGALYFGFAVINWMARSAPIGGIYNRPLVLANLLHFVPAGIALIKVLIDGADAALLWPLALGYETFAAGFVFALFRGPSRTNDAVASRL